MRNGVLIVDDMPQTRVLLGRVLRRAGMLTFEAGCGAMAYAVARSHPDEILVFLVDVDLPGASGPEVAEALVKAIPSARVVFMTGHPIPELVAAGCLDSTAVVLQKPFTLASVIAVVRACERAEHGED